MHQVNGNTEIIAHIGFPTHSFKSPMIYNPYFVQAGINALVVPMGCKSEYFPDFLRSVFQLSNIRGALITMPHKVTSMALLDEVSPTALIAGACNAIKRGQDGKLTGDMFDGAGFVRGVQRKGLQLANARVLVVGCGGVGSAIAASLAGQGISEIRLFDVNGASAESLAVRIRKHYPNLRVSVGSNDPADLDLVVNATPLGMDDGDPLPVDINRFTARTFVGEVVMKSETTAFLAAARQRGCQTQVGTDMLFEQIPAYLEFFGFPSTTPENLRNIAQLGQ
jgi:shikimate dehydrogenase